MTGTPLTYEALIDALGKAYQNAEGHAKEFEPGHNKAAFSAVGQGLASVLHALNDGLREQVQCYVSPDGQHNKVSALDGEGQPIAGYSICGYCGKQP